MASKYAQGAAFERSVKAKLEREGALYVVRSAGSKGVADLVAFQSPVYRSYPEVWLVQVKRGGSLPKREARKLLEVAKATGATAMLAFKDKNRISIERIEL